MNEQERGRVLTKCNDVLQQAPTSNSYNRNDVLDALRAILAYADGEGDSREDIVETLRLR